MEHIVTKVTILVFESTSISSSTFYKGFKNDLSLTYQKSSGTVLKCGIYGFITGLRRIFWYQSEETIIRKTCGTKTLFLDVNSTLPLRETCNFDAIAL